MSSGLTDIQRLAMAVFGADEGVSASKSISWPTAASLVAEVPTAAPAETTVSVAPCSASCYT